MYAVQIPLKLSTALAAAVQQDPWCLTSCAALFAVNRIVIFGSEKTAQTNSKASVTKLRQQIEQGGCVLKLPDMMTSAVACLTAPTAPDVSSSGSSSSGWQDPLFGEAHCGLDESDIDALLELLGPLKTLWPEGAPRLTLALTLGPVTLQLVRALTQRVSFVLQQQQQPLTRIAVVGRMGYCSYRATLSTLSELEFKPPNSTEARPEWWSRPEAAALVASVHFLPCMVWLTSVLLFAVAGDWKQDAGQGSRRSAGSSSSTSSTHSGHSHEAAWQQVSSNLGLITPCQQQLMTLLGVDGSTVLCHAGIMSGIGTAKPSYWSALSISMIMLHDLHVNLWSKAAGLVQPADKLHMHLHMLLPSLWLAWAAHTAKPNSDGPPDRKHVSKAIARAAAVSCDSLMHWSQMSQQQQESASATDPWAVQGQALPAVLVKELLPQVLHLLPLLLGQQAKREQQGVVKFISMIGLLLLPAGMAAGGAAAAAGGPQDSNTTTSAGSSTAQHATLQVVQDNLSSLLSVLDAAVRDLARGSYDASEVALAVGSLSRLLNSGVLTPPVCNMHNTSTPTGHTLLQAFFSLLSSMLKLSVVVLASGVAGCADTLPLLDAVATAALSVTRSSSAAASMSVHDTASAGSSSTSSPSSTSSTGAASSSASSTRSVTCKQPAEGLSSIIKVLPSLFL